MIYLVIGINQEGGILPLYFTNQKEQASKALEIIESEKEERNLKQVKLLGELSND